jgi:hypothetical protein
MFPKFSLIEMLILHEAALSFCNLMIFARIHEPAINPDGQFTDAAKILLVVTLLPQSTDSGFLTQTIDRLEKLTAVIN